jgi:hypothetical protein
MLEGRAMKPLFFLTALCLLSLSGCMPAVAGKDFESIAERYYGTLSDSRGGKFREIFVIHKDGSN